MNKINRELFNFNNYINQHNDSDDDDNYTNSFNSFISNMPYEGDILNNINDTINTGITNNTEYTNQGLELSSDYSTYERDIDKVHNSGMYKKYTESINNIFSIPNENIKNKESGKIHKYINGGKKKI